MANSHFINNIRRLAIATLRGRYYLLTACAMLFNCCYTYLAPWPSWPNAVVSVSIAGKSIVGHYFNLLLLEARVRPGHLVLSELARAGEDRSPLEGLEVMFFQDNLLQEQPVYPPGKLRRRKQSGITQK